jgi:hypothetical protein
MTDVPSVGWREVYRWCGVAPELEPEVVGRGFDPPDSMSYEKVIAQITGQLVRSDSRKETVLAIGFLVAIGAIFTIQGQREKQGSVRFEQIE